MQLFIIDKDPHIAAFSLADCHVRKQILETAQILTAYWVNSGYDRLEWMPKPQNYNHPVARAINNKNVRWVIKHFHSLIEEFKARFEKTHAYEINGVLFNICIPKSLISEDVEIETFHRMFFGFKPEPSDIVSEYRQYYRWKSTQIKDFKYTNVNPPEWLEVAE